MTIAEYERSVRQNGAPMITSRRLAQQGGLWIEVTEEDIEAAREYRWQRYNYGRYCPIALACYRAGLRVVRVSPTQLLWLSDGEPERTRLPSEARKFVGRFDRDEPIEPIRFFLKYGG